MSAHTGSVAGFFLLVLLTQGLGQSALSVASITAVGKGSLRRVGLAMGVYSVLMSLLFGAGFKIVGDFVQSAGWRAAWRESPPGSSSALRRSRFFSSAVQRRGLRTTGAGRSVRRERARAPAQALRAPAFWIFAAGDGPLRACRVWLWIVQRIRVCRARFSQETYH